MTYPCLVSVASFTDAWIETFEQTMKQLQIPVASFTDAWIETTPFYSVYNTTESHLLQMRGLKQVGK